MWNSKASGELSKGATMWSSKASGESHKGSNKQGAMTWRSEE